ncbi:glutarate dioxygenase GlaH [Burkholderia pseudomultivorans]|uniref:glutarate dioxygenase GlaH n=1 Tax=Burkholderia pseudomultivorans TaxID=1207504 RepID=UPI002874707F|nr:glutarate dioxygenase GlaH [Burkholderia pseudomultivorans]MDS0858221.1 glutarate dioxygenase GlaH [Burkholderia pseudomultivorans]
MEVTLASPGAATRQPSFDLSPHPHHHRLVHVTADRDALAGFLDDVRDIDVQNLEYVPYMRFHLADLLVKRLGHAFAIALVDLVKDRRHGGFTIGLQGLSSDASDYVKFGTAIGHILGPGNHDAMSGTYYARFVVRHTDDSDSYLRQAYRLFTMHTDGTFVSEATDWLLMMKFAEQNAVGGESRFLHLDDWEAREDFVNHKFATKPFLYKAPGSKNVSERVERPIFFQSEFGLSMSFIDQFVQPGNREEAAFLYELSASMETSSGTTEVVLPIGDLVVLNNYFYVHGRAPFVRHDGLFRELMRQRGAFAS